MPSFRHAIIALLTSSDSKAFSTLDIFWLIDPNKKLLIDIDLSGSTLISFLKGKILFFIFKLNLLDGIKFYEN
jgi:hypothetical protein